MKMIVTINKATGAFSHPFFAPTVEEATQAMTKINPENLSDLQFHELCEFKNNTDIFRLRLGPENPTSKHHLNQLMTDTDNSILQIEKLQQSLNAVTDKDWSYYLQLEYQLASLRLESAKYALDFDTIYNSLADT